MKTEPQTGELNLFWKKKADNKYKLRFESKDKRNSYRLKALRSEKLCIYLNSKAFEISNISAGGVAFFSSEFSIGDFYDFELPLPDTKANYVKGKIEIAGFENGLTRAKFIEIDENDKERIHKFIFEKQIKYLRKSKQNKKQSDNLF